MSKENKNTQTKNGSSIVATVTNSLNKHGEIKGKDKKETKNLRAMCPHHKITKKGNIKATIINDGAGTCTCLMCGASWSTDLPDKDEVKKILKPVKELLDMSRFLAEAADLGKETKAYLAKVSVDMAHLPKTYNKITHVVKKSESIKNKKRKGNKNNNSYDGGSQRYGGWK